MCVRDDTMHMMTKIDHCPGRLYVLDVELARPVYLAAGDHAWRWHACFSHVNFGALQKVAREELVHGLQLLSQVEQVFEGWR
jgi:hypothetical protein